MIRVLAVGDVVGSPGRSAFARFGQRAKSDGLVDFIVVNAENAAGGRGLTPAVAQELLQSGADVLTLGDHAWDQKEVMELLEKEPRVLRPANFAPLNPGSGWRTFETPKGRVTVVNLVGRVFLPPADCPFRTIDAILARPEDIGRVILVDIHAEATSEKMALGWYLDGRVSLVVGTHTHIQTADERILPKGTGYLTDLGMCGARDSVLGRDKEAIIQKFLTGRPAQFKVATDDVWVEGLYAEIDGSTGHAVRLRRFQVPAGKEYEWVPFPVGTEKVAS